MKMQLSALSQSKLGSTIFTHDLRKSCDQIFMKLGIHAGNISNLWISLPWDLIWKEFDMIIGSIALNTGSTGFYQFWTELSAAVQILGEPPLVIYMRFYFNVRKGQFEGNKWYVFYNHICKLKEIVADFIWSPLIKKVCLWFTANL